MKTDENWVSPNSGILPEVEFNENKVNGNTNKNAEIIINLDRVGPFLCQCHFFKQLGHIEFLIHVLIMMLVTTTFLFLLISFIFHRV